MRALARVSLLVASLATACGGGAPADELLAISLPPPGSRAAPSGRGSFTLGASTAATQIEDQNPHTDWYLWTRPAPEGMGRGAFVGEATRGYSLALADVALLEELRLDSYRFSVEWARVEPRRGVIDEGALAHYDALLSELVARGLRPMVTVHHFASPVWVDDPRVETCVEPGDDNLCGWGHPRGADAIIAALAAHAGRLGARYGDRVDDWATLNEPVNYLIASYGVGVFPPGRNLLLTDLGAFMTVVRNYLRAHVAIHDALKASDTIDADGDGIAASVGFTLNVAEWAPARNNLPSTHPEDVAAADRVRWAYHHLFVEALRQGRFDADLDGAMDEEHPAWAGKLDWLGVQYYSRNGVTGAVPLIPGVRAMVCFAGFDLGSCLEPEEPTHWVPSMHYETFAPGLYNVLKDFSGRWPDLPLTVTESGLATEVGRRRAEHVVRALEQIGRAREEGVDVRGYYHWSLTDNFEWAEGFAPRFGLYRVDYATYARTATEGARVLAEIAGARIVTKAQRARYGGLGPMTPEPAAVSGAAGRRSPAPTGTGQATPEAPPAPRPRAW
jgi:beta-glucosidase/6-phospho-beta-glucosidase/beta-galactosidase